MLTSNVKNRIRNVYQIHGNIQSEVTIGGTTPKLSSDHRRSMSKWFRAKPIKYCYPNYDLEKSRYFLNIFDYSNIVTYGWGHSKEDMNVFFTDSSFKTGWNGKSVDHDMNIVEVYSKYFGFEYDSWFNGITKAWNTIESGIRTSYDGENHVQHKTIASNFWVEKWPEKFEKPRIKYHVVELPKS